MAQIQYFGTGRRKEAIARVRLVPGKGKIIINGKPVEEYFKVHRHRQLVLQPLTEAGMEGSFDVLARVEGGGITGQAGAIRLGIARALLEVDQNLRPSLKRKGYLTRDPRMKERKKYGLKKARKAPQFSKR